MFGRKGLGRGTGGSGTGGSGGSGIPGGGNGANGAGGQPPRRGLESVVEQGGSIDRAMVAAITVMSEALQAAGQDPGGLGMGGGVGDDAADRGVSKNIADCITYEGREGPEYITLSVTQDFKAFSYQPHCFLFVIANAVGICEDLPDPQSRAQIAGPQCSEPLFHAHVMRCWSRQVLPVGAAMAAGDNDALGRCLAALQLEIRSVIDRAPPWMHQHLDMMGLAGGWLAGFPATIGRPLDADVKRLNFIPMPDFVHQTLTDWLVQMQAGAMQQRRA